MEIQPQLVMCGRLFGFLLWCAVLAFLFALGKRKPRVAWALAIPCLAAMGAAVVAIVRDAGLDEYGLQFALWLAGGYFIYGAVLLVERVLQSFQK